MTGHRASTSPHRRPRGQQGRRYGAWRLGVPLAFAAAGLLASTSMINAQGTDLRGGRSGDLSQLVLSQRDDVWALRSRVRRLRRDIDRLSDQVSVPASRRISRRADTLDPAVGTTPVRGPGVEIALTDAPRDVEVPDGTDPNVLVVHQQDIQAVVNALWAGGASGITVQGQRIVTTTGIKCVGNTVVLEGVPYSPPYRIAAVGDVPTLLRALDESAAVQNYLSYTAPPYRLGWRFTSFTDRTLPGYTGTFDLTYARPVS